MTTTENLVEIGIDGGLELAPVPFETAIKRSSLDKASQNIVRAQIGKVQQAATFAKDQIIEQNNNLIQTECVEDECDD